jgi:hypothetical protein
MSSLHDLDGDAISLVLPRAGADHIYPPQNIISVQGSRIRREKISARILVLPASYSHELIWGVLKI